MFKTKINRLLIVIFLASTLTSSAQEILATVKVVADQVANVDKRVFKTMETSITEFLNNTKWTTDGFKQEERIEISLLINVTNAVSNDQFTGTLQIQTRRPVYKSSYTTMLLNYNDNDFNFKYVEYQPFEFNENTFTNNLTSMVAFYAYVAVGLDYDSFSLEGGTPYFQKALNVTNLSQNGGDKGWKSFDDDKNRYWLIENLLNSNFKTLRTCVYNYHLNGLDKMTNDLPTARKTIADALISLDKVYQTNPNSYLMLVFFQAKADEIVNIFKPAPAAEKTKLLPVLNLINPANTQKYNKMQQ
ncbi:MAG: DUF4835 family protein [Bacteroidota bacterium]